MLTKYDELTCHQIVSTLDHPQTSDRAWTEKLWCNVHDTKGQISLATGLGVYPNRNVLDGFGCVTLEGARQHNVRVSRELRPRLDELTVGPLTYEVLEPYRRIRLAMAENDRGLSYDLEFLGRLQPAEEEPQFGRNRGRMFVNTCRYAQLGRARGWIEVDGQRYEVDEEHHFAQRDHSWGVRMGVGAPEQGVQAPDISTFMAMMINWLTLQFGDWGVTCYLIEKADGRIEYLSGSRVSLLDNEAPPVPVTHVEHAYEYHPSSARMKGGTVTFTFADGVKAEIAMRELTTMYLRGGAYIGYKGYTHGLWMGPSWMDGEVWEVAKAEVANEVHGLDDTVVEARTGDEVGYGIVENLILPPFPRYGF